MDIDKLTDRELMEMMVASFTMRRISGEKFEDPDSQALERRISEMMKKTLENLDSVSTLTTKLIDANDNLATERSSNRRLKKLLCDIAVVLWEHRHQNDVVRKIKAADKERARADARRGSK